MKEKKDEIYWNWDLIAEARTMGISNRILGCIMSHRNPRPAFVTLSKFSNPKILEMTTRIGCMVS